MKTKVLLFKDAVSLIHSKLKLLSFVLNSPNVLDTLISLGKLFHIAAPLYIRETFTNIIGARLRKSQPHFIMY